MKNFLVGTAVFTLTASAVFANANDPVEIVRDGMIYNCASDMIVVEGVKSHRCSEVGGASEAGGGLFAAGLDGIGVVAALGVILLISTVVTNDNNDSAINTN